MEIKQAIIVIADISGYTKFVTLHTMSLLHAEKIVTELMEAIIDETRSPLIVNKLEGDAILFYAEAGDSGAETARTVLRQTLDFFEAFNTRSVELTGCNNLCPCDACREADQLRLKTVIHYGDIAIKRIRNFVELAGEAVILAHRLTKNSIPSDEYVLMTKPFIELCGAPEGTTTESRTENFDDLGVVPIDVYYPNPQLAPSEDLGKKSLARTLGNAIRLDAYGFARTLGLKAPPGVEHRSTRRPGFWNFAGDGLKGLGMLFRAK